MSYPADSTVDFQITHLLEVKMPAGVIPVKATRKDMQLWADVVADTVGYKPTAQVAAPFFTNSGCVFLCYMKGELIATSGWRRSGTTAYLGYTGVRSKHRFMGIGAAIVALAVNDAFAAGCVRVIVQTTFNRPSAMRLYFRLGFEFVRSKYPVSKEELQGITATDKGCSPRGCNLVRLGSQIAGWWVDLSMLNASSVIYSFGLGSDVSFELDLLKEKGCTIYGFDPTPGVMELWQGKVPKEFMLKNLGLDSTDCKKTMSPLHAGWVTYTVFDSLVVEKDITRKPMVVQMKRLLTIMQELKHPHIDLLKIDIEGCEYVVIDDIVKSGIRPSQFMVEWHPLEGCDKDVFIKKITDCGYVVTRLEGINYTFCKER